jgi:hypothetical protein
MTAQMLAYGVELNIVLGDVDTTDPDQMREFLGNNTETYYLSSTMRKQSARQPVLFVTCWHRAYHEMIHYLVATKSTWSTNKLGYTLPETNPDWNEILRTEFLALSRHVSTEEGCTIEPLTPEEAVEFDPQWLVMDSDD